MLISPGTKPYLFQFDTGFREVLRNRNVEWRLPGLSEFTFIRTYARKKANGKLENWNECVIRVIEGMFTILKTHAKLNHVVWDETKAQRLAREAAERMFLFKWLPPGRGLWMMGTDFIWERGAAAANNCGFVSTERIGESRSETVLPFRFLMDMSMLGVGVGFDTKGAHNDVKVQGYNSNTEVVIVEDSREGWVNLIGRIIENGIYGGPRIIGDMSQVRPAGLPIKGFGGVSSGPEPLERAALGIADVLQSRARNPRNYLTSTDIVDVQNMIGKCVVAGNVRRCLPKGTLVHTTKGMKNIEDVNIGDEVYTASGTTVVTDTIYQGSQTLTKVTTQLGDFFCTKQHRMAYLTGFDSYDWKTAGELLPGDRLVFPVHLTDGIETELPSWHYEKPQHSTTCKDIIIPELNGEIAWFFGFFHGNGYVFPNFSQSGFNAYVSLSINGEQDETLNRIVAVVRKFGLEPEIRKPTDDDNSYKVHVQSKQLAWYLAQFKTAKSEINIPGFIAASKPWIRAGYLAGLFDSDGCCKNRPINAVTSVYPHFVSSVQALYASLGIPVKKVPLPFDSDKQWQPKQALNLVGMFAIRRFAELMGPRSSKYFDKGTTRSQNGYGYPVEFVDDCSIKLNRKWDQNSKQLSYDTYQKCGGISTLIPIEVFTVEDTEMVAETYDLSVCDHHEFMVQEGLLVHNSAEIAFAEPEDEMFMKMKNWAAHGVAMGTVAPEELKNVSLDDYNAYNSNIWDTRNGVAQSIVKKYHEEPWSYKFGGWRWASNNSLFARVGMDYQQFEASIRDSGEPGFAWLDVMRRFGRMRDPENNLDHRVKGGNPCLEQSLESYELCCLVENFPGYHDDYWDFQRTLKFSYLYAKTVTLMGTHFDRTNSVIIRNRRIGCSLSGIIDAIGKTGRTRFMHEYCDKGYSYIQYIDRKYCDWLGVPLSIKKTSVKPSGTTSLVAGVSGPGIHFPKMKTGYRLVRVALNSDLVPLLRAANYRVESAVSDPMHTVVVYFPWISPENIITEEEVTIWEKFKMAADLQYWWADNQVSCTVEFTTEEAERHEISRCLSAFDGQLKGISLLPKVEGIYPQMPYTTAPREEVVAYREQLLPLDFTVLTHEGENCEANKFCDSTGCLI